jgi:hypothetical protein
VTELVRRAPAAYALAACIIAGAAFAWMRSPLPWMIGPLGAMAALKFAGLPLRAPRGGREVGQWLIATALGLYFTPTVAREVTQRWEVLVAAAIFATILGYIGAWILSRYTDTDRTTALFASIPGGATEMAILGERFGGRPDRIALAQSLRILLVVVIIPFTFAAWGVQGSDFYRQVAAPVNTTGLAALLGTTAIGGTIFALMRLPNAWMLGPLAMAIAVTAMGVEWSAMPTLATNAGQVLIGCALGARFEREFMRAAPRYVFVVTVSILAAIACSALFAALLSQLSGVPLATLVLATAPGGIGEMCITAKVLQLGVPVVTAAHVTRVMILVTTSAPLFRFARRARAMLRSGRS